MIRYDTLNCPHREICLTVYNERMNADEAAVGHEQRQTDVWMER